MPWSWLRSRGFECSLVLFFVLLAVNTTLRLTWTGEGRRASYVVGMDPNCYYAFGHSVWFDHDVRMRNQYEHIIETQPKWLADQFAALLRENLDRPPNRFPAGAGLVAVPALAVAEALVWLAGGRGVSPFALVYVLAFYWTQLLLGVAALWLLHWILRRWFDCGIATISVWAACLCGPMIFYLVYDPGMPHLAGLFFAAGTVAAWLKGREACDSPRAAAAWGIAFGAMYGIALMVRPYNLPLGILALEPLAVTTMARHRGEQRALRGAVLFLTVAVVATLVAFLPQMLIWHAQYGHLIANPQGHRFWHWPRYWASVLVSRRHGLLFWAPAYVFAFSGLALAWRRMHHPAVVFTLVLLGAIWMMGAWRTWWLGVAFGMRGFIDFLYVIAFGFGALIACAPARFGRRAKVIAVELLVLFALINAHLAIAFRAGAVYVDGPLFWLDSVSYGKEYKAQLVRDWRTWTEFSPGSRAPLY